MVNLIRRYEDAFRKFRNLPAITDLSGNRNYTYFQLAGRIDAFHRKFRELDLNKGDKVAIVGRNSSEWICTYLSTITYGATVVPILADFNPVDMAGIIDHSDAVLLFADKSFLDRLDKAAMPKIRHSFCLEESFAEIASDFDIEKFHFPEVALDDISEISYTSGTTGVSKGVMLPLRSLSYNVDFAMTKEFFKEGSRSLGMLPLAHAYGCAFDMLSPLAAGTHIFVLGKIPSPKVLLQAMAKVKPCLLCTVPLVIEKIVQKSVFPALEKQPVKTLLKIPFARNVIYSNIRKRLLNAFGGEVREINMGGAALDRKVEDLLKAIKFPFTVGYGMTEAGPLVCYVGWREFKQGSCGKLLPGTQIRIERENPDDEAGRICLKGPGITTGYYKNPESTASSLRDGWFQTGDMGFVDAEGNVFLRGRCTSMILNSSGQNIYPEEIEDKLNHLDLVAESIVYEDGGKLHALVVPDFDRIKNEAITSDTLAEIMKSNLKALNHIVAPYEKVADIRLNAEPFEKTPKRSIKRFLYPSKAKLMDIGKCEDKTK